MLGTTLYNSLSETTDAAGDLEKMESLEGVTTKTDRGISVLSARKALLSYRRSAEKAALG